MILEDNARNSEFMEAIENETSCFNSYIKNPSEEKQNELERACNRTSSAVSRLPYDYDKTGTYRYARTWAIRNSYDVYSQKRDRILKMSEENPNYIKELYKIYNMQVFLHDYGRQLMTVTLKEGTGAYIQKAPYLKQIPCLFLLAGIILTAAVISLARLMNETIISPVINLSEVSKKLAASGFHTKEIKVDNRDEIGELVKAFNKMQEEIRQHITTLEEKKTMADLLHKEEVEKLELIRHLEAAKLEVVKNQIKPHFLFNTLNVIGGMAKLEEARTTEKMIKALSNLFRYNLKTPQAEVTLAQELKVAEEYLYIQQMRFGERVKFHIECQVDLETVRIPTFSFQPLIENAIIHGICQKEQGGSIYIRIWKEGQYISISVADTGTGIEKEKLREIRQALEKGNNGQIGIGLENIYKRIKGMYPEGQLQIFSRQEIGTAVKIRIPQSEEEGMTCIGY